MKKVMSLNPNDCNQVTVVHLGIQLIISGIVVAFQEGLQESELFNS